MKFFALIISFTIFLAQAEKIKITTDAWQDVTEKDGSGIYLNVLKEIYGTDNIEINIESYHRSLKSFEENNVDIVLGVFREDVQQAILPKWYIDTDEPIYVFYRPEHEQMIHINNLSDFTNSWVRGFHFERFFDGDFNAYKVNTANEGFKLLANKRIDTFIDYLSNVPPGLNEKFRYFELLPSRRLYIAFQKNQYGQNLANIFDEKMSELRRSGKLKELYGTLYHKSELALFQENKEKMIILTDEVNLIRGSKNNKSTQNQTLNTSLNMLFDQLDEYEVEFKLVKDYANIEQNKDQENLCYTDMLKTPERLRHYQFSSPFSLYLGLQLYSKTPLPTDDDNQVNLVTLLAENQEKKLGFVAGRSFNEALDKQIATINKNQLIEIPIKLNRSLAIFNHDRFNYLIEYPQYVDLHWPNISSQTLFAYPIKGGKRYSVGHMMCTKTTINNIFIKQFNENVERLVKSGSLYNVLTSEISNDKHAKFKRYFQEVFPQNRQNP